MPPPWVLRECGTAGRLSDAETQAEQEAIIRADRLKLAECRRRHRAAVGWINGVEAALNNRAGR